MSLNFLRKIVSGKRNRYTEDGFNLDLTYITSRIIASSYPASGIESTYRNKITDVAKFLKQKHPDAFKIYNLSGRIYPHDYFNGKVEDYTTWGDHHSPPLHVLVEIVESIYKFLSQNPSNIVLLHCNAGKGRTGTAISSSLIYCGMTDSAEDALRYYSYKRFARGCGGVTQPCQVRYVKYFQELAKRHVKSASPKIFKQMIINAFPGHSGSSGDSKPTVEFYQYHFQNLIYTAKVATKPCGCKQDAFCTQAKICPNISILMCDDIYIKIKRGSKLLCRFCFNTAFVGPNNKLKFFKRDMDPDSVQVNKNFPDNFEVILYFSDMCDKCTNQTAIEDYCHNCMAVAKKSFSNWAKISVIMNTHVLPKPESEVAGSLAEFENIRKYFAEEFKKDSEIEYSDEEDNVGIEDAKEFVYEESIEKPMQALKPAVKVFSGSPKGLVTDKVEVPKGSPKTAAE